MRRASDAEEAADRADLLAETYATAWHKLDAIPRGDQAPLWLFGVARSLLLRSIRRRRVAAAVTGRLADELRAVQPAPAGDDDDDDGRRLRDALAERSEGDREIVMLTAWEDLTPRSIAQVMGTSANVVRIRLHRARKQLRQRLDSEPETAPWRPLAAPIDS